MSELEDFTKFLFGTRTGFVYAPLKKADNTWVMQWFNWPLQRQAIHDHIRTNTIESDVYLSPVLFREKKLSKASVKSASAIWVEFDGKTTLDLKNVPEPDYIIQSSTEDHQHIYWNVGDNNAESIEDANRRLTYYLGADSSGWDITQVLRPPETTNHKPGKNLPVTVRLANVAGIHALSGFDIAPEIPRFIPIELDTIPPVERVLQDHQFPKELLERIHKEVPLEKKRSDFLMNTGHLLAEAGLNHAEIVSVIFMMDGRVRKFLGRDDALVRISELASKAIHKFQSKQKSVEIYSPLEILNHADKLEWYLDKILPKRGFMFLTGSPGVGKSAFVSDLIYALSTGTSFLGIPPTEPLVTLFFSLEMYIEELQYFWEIQQADWENKELWNQNAKVYFDIDIENPLMEAIIKSVQPQVVIIDSTSEVMEDAKSEEEGRKLVKFLRGIQIELNTSFVFIHHNRKISNNSKPVKPASLSDLYGTYYLAKACQSVLSIWKDPNKTYYELDNLKGRFNGDSSTWALLRNANINYERTELNSEPNQAGNAGNLLPGNKSENLQEFG